jgi:NAD(P)-dependent dehydrogenase (short-subunit alcohol dehydrogenase family)
VATATSRRALAVETNVSRWDDCDRLVETVYREFGACHVLVNNAGLSPLYPDLPSVTEALYDKTHAVNAMTLGLGRIGRPEDSTGCACSSPRTRPGTSTARRSSPTAARTVACD